MAALEDVVKENTAMKARLAALENNNGTTTPALPSDDSTLSALKAQLVELQQENAELKSSNSTLQSLKQELSNNLTAECSRADEERKYVYRLALGCN